MAVRVGSQYPFPTPEWNRPDRRSHSQPSRSTINDDPIYFVEPIGERLFENEKKWQDVQVPYENYAGDRNIADRARHFVLGHLQRTQDHSEALRRKWMTIERVLKGNTITRWTGGNHVHVPEVYKMLETMVPRVEEAIFSFDPWFHVFGREESDRDQEDKIRWFLDYQLDQASFSEYVQPFVRCMLTYAFAMLKIRWRRKWGQRVIKIGRREPRSDGTFHFRYTKEEKREIVYEGPDFDLVDPFSAIIDNATMLKKDMRIIGEESWKSESELLELEAEGAYVNVSELLSQAPVRSRGSTDYYRMSRSQTWLDDENQREPEGSDRRYKVTEIWGNFDLLGDGIRPCKLTVGNDRTVLCAQENPFDDKFTPYAVARASREPFQFHGVGPFDHSIRLNMELDDHRNLALEAHRLAVNPIVFVDTNADIPASLYDVLPGQVFRVNNPRDVQFGKIPISIRDAQSITEELRRDIEEATGAPRIWEGSDSPTGSGTATEVERKIQEGNRRLKSLVRSVSFAFRDMLTMMHSMNRQFVTREQTFRVLGKKAKGLSVYSEVAPETFLPKVDFEMQGLAGLATLGLRATNLVQYVQTIANLLPYSQGVVNIPGLELDLYKAMVNERPGDEIINEPPSLDQLMTPEEENMMLAQGQRVEIHPNDDDEAHERAHQAYGTSEAFAEKSPTVQGLLFEHRAAHESQRERKLLKQRALEQQSPAFPNSQPQVGVNGRGAMQPAMPSYGGTGSGPEGQAPGVTPGSQNRPNTPMQTPGRDGQIFQTQNSTQGQS